MGWTGQDMRQVLDLWWVFVDVYISRGKHSKLFCVPRFGKVMFPIALICGDFATFKIYFKNLINQLLNGNEIVL